MDNNQKLLDAVTAAMRDAGYSNITASTTGDASIIGAKDAGGAYFRLTAGPKTAASLRTTSGGPEAQAARLDVSAVPSAAGLQEHVMQNLEQAPAFGFTPAAMELLK